jgi:hypothetical protein
MNLPYHATPPALDVVASPGDRSVVLQWHTSADPSSIVVSRSPGVHGAANSVLDRGGASSYTDGHVRNGVRYVYSVTARDQAGNVSKQTIVVRPGPRLLSPASGTRVGAPPLLSWTPVKGANYYNVQLYRGRKILSAWPKGASLKLRRHWSFAGRRFRLKPGRYRWFVWPGYGSPARAQYGALIGSGTFTVT